MTLRATRPILYQNKIYQAGEILPCYDAPLVRAWLEAGSAAYDDAVPAPVTAAPAPLDPPAKAVRSTKPPSKTKKGAK